MAIVPMRSSRVTIYPHKYHRRAKLIEQQRKERSGSARFTRTATFVGCPTFRAGAQCEQDPMNRSSGLPTSVRRSRNAAAGHSYAFAAVVAAGALRGDGTANRSPCEEGGARKSAGRAVPGSGRCPATLRGTRFRRAVGASARQRQHDPGLSIQRIGRPGRQELQGHRHRPSGLRPAAAHGMSSGRPMPRPS